MGPIGIIALLSGLMLATLMGGDADDAPQNPTTDPDPTPQPDPQADVDPQPDSMPDVTEPSDGTDIGASVVEAPDGSLEIELGEDETGSLVALKFDETFAPSFDISNRLSLGIYLLPEGNEVPIVPTQGLVDTESLESLIQELGLTELAFFDLGAVSHPEYSSEDFDTRVEPPQITANAPIDIIRVPYSVSEDGEEFINTERDETLSPFEPAGFYVDGTEARVVTEDFVGTQNQDVVLAPFGQAPDGMAFEGRAGDDFIMSDSASASLDGGDGNDSLYAFGDANTVEGGAGDDVLFVGSNGLGFGGDGDDTLSSYGGGYSAIVDFRQSDVPQVENLNLVLSGEGGDDTMFVQATTETARGGVGNDTLSARGGGEVDGDEGNDAISLFDAGSTGNGGAGDDSIHVRAGTFGFGGSGNDTFVIEAGGTANGGAGDDTFDVNYPFRDEDGPAILDGSAGADTYNISASGVTDGEAPHLAITDFDPTEDVLVIAPTSGQSDLLSLEVVEAPDGNSSNLRATYAPVGGQPSGVLIVRLEDVTGVTAEQVAVVG